MRYYADGNSLHHDRLLYKDNLPSFSGLRRKSVDLFVVTELKRYLDNTEQSSRNWPVCSISNASYLCRFFLARRNDCSVSEQRFDARTGSQACFCSIRNGTAVRRKKRQYDASSKWNRRARVFDGLFCVVK